MLVKSTALFLAAASLLSVSASPVTLESQDALPDFTFPPFNATQVAIVEDQVRTIFINDLAFDANTTHHDDSDRSVVTTTPDNIVKYIRFAGAAYKINSLNWTCAKNCESPDTQGTKVEYHWDKKGLRPSYGYVAVKENTKEIIVAFRGSTTFMDWVTDARFNFARWPSDIKGAKVHDGFRDAYFSDASNIKSAVSRLLDANPSFSIVLVGHSLGGAEATVAAADFALTHPEWKSKLALYTCGQPRVGNSVFADWLSSQPFPIFRITYHSDIVTQLPPRILGYKHISQEVYYPASGELKFCGSDPESKSCENGVFPLTLSVIDHISYPGLRVKIL
ncbi:hypothetical protein GGI12_005602 [Dipsacomyces acuminosporus]|nr:hypothetical protein GGI12_005602 [Dipsacomyces acuminosporus]